jgi:hypothetical protein
MNYNTRLSATVGFASAPVRALAAIGQLKRALMATAITWAVASADAQTGGTVNFGNHSSSLVTNGQTSLPVTTSDNVQAALYWAPLGSESFVQLGAAVPVGTPLAGVFVGGTRTNGTDTPGGGSGLFQVRAWSGGYGTYEQALTHAGVLIGQSAVITNQTGNPSGVPPSAPVSLLAGGFSGFTLTNNSGSVARPTTTALATSGSPSSYGGSVTFTATVQTNGVAAGNATSNYVFLVDGAAVATNAVSSGQATYATSFLTACSHTITAQYTGDANYLPGTNSLTQTVNPATLTVTASATLVYGSDPTNAVYTPSYSPLQGTDTVSVVSGSADFSTAAATSYVGTNYSAHVVDLGTLSASNYTFAIGPDGILTITPAQLTVTNLLANNKTYDGTTNATFDASGAGLDGLVNGDDVTLNTNGEAGAFADPNVGTGKTVTVSGLALNGDLGTNYTLIQPTATADIDPLGTTTLLAVDINPSGLTTNVTFTATVAGMLPTVGLPTSNVVFLANGTPFATNGPLVAGSGSGSITASTPALPVGTNAITAQYLGDGNYLPSTNTPPLAQVVTNNVIYSHTNRITSITNNHNGTFTLYMVGTPGAAYYVVTNANLRASMTLWTPLEAGNHTAGGDGTWSCTVSNPAPAYYRARAVNPAP